MHAKVFRERRFFWRGGLFREEPEGVEGRMEGGGGGAEDAGGCRRVYLYVCVEGVFEWVCLHVLSVFLRGRGKEGWWRISPEESDQELTCRLVRGQAACSLLGKVVADIVTPGYEGV